MKIRIFKRMTRAEESIKDLQNLNNELFLNIKELKAFRTQTELTIKLEKENITAALKKMWEELDKVKEQIRKIGVVNDELGVLEKLINDSKEEIEKGGE